MKLKLIPTAHELISNMRSFFQINDKVSYAYEEPLREELFTSGQMEHFGKMLATRHKLSTEPSKDHLLKRLSDNETTLQEVRKLLTDSIKRKLQIMPAGEWLIDNYYLVEEHIRLAKTHFPKNYSEDLPQLDVGDSLGLTRSYDIVLKIIAHSDGRINVERLSSFIKAYQSVTPLKLGELWSIPIMLRLALIENIRRVSARIAIDMIDRNLADYWSKRMVETSEEDPRSLILVIADMARSNPPIVGAFVSELTRQLRGKGPDLGLVLNWIEQQLSGSGLTSAELVNAENQKLAADQVSISNSIGSLRLIGALDWRDFVETHSLVEQTLFKDPAGIYGLMDFETRDRYRHVVEELAKKSSFSEYEVAEMAIQLTSKNSTDKTGDQRESHVGYYLVDDGFTQTKELAKIKTSTVGKTKLFLGRYPLAVYIIPILLITLAVSAGILQKGINSIHSIELLLLIAFLLLLSTSQLAISIVNFFVTLLVKPKLLPKMDYADKIPRNASTFVVIPAMLTYVDAVENLVDELEIRFLANRNDNLYFGLLTDFTDAKQESLPSDEVLLETVKNGIEKLNRKYQRDKNDLFYLFHRPRKWNPRQKAWMGYERKRGKICHLNSLLRGEGKECFSLVIGDQTIFPKIKYVITLDEDTQLPLNTAGKLIGTIAHPLNRPRYDEKKKRIIKGYGILQPRVDVSLPDETGSLYARLNGNEPGIDPYTRASSDVYQDLFGEGSFIGKGIYEIDTFQKVLDGRFLENRILSHDLLEGCYIRSGLISDIQLFEKYPVTYKADIKRRTRWIRGDWQILSWIFPLVKGPENRLYKNPVSGLSKWKIFDNIRRSLVPLALTALLLLGWIVLRTSLFWTITVSCIIIFPIFISTLWNSLRKPENVGVYYHLKNSLRDTANITVKTLFTLVCLPFEAFSNGKAILRTLWRMLITRKRLLEWNPSSHISNVNSDSLWASYSSMWIEPVLSVILFVFLGLYFPEKLLIAGPILVLWFIAPFVAWFTSKPLKKQVAMLTVEQRLFLHKLARKTWSYFEHFVVAGDNWLPPDNYQEKPEEQTAHRTSPTNIGLSLLANLNAADFGFITISQLLERTTNTLDTMQKMKRYKGHFYNWYDTESLKPLAPKYISTVDSGNLAGHLMVLKQGLLALPDQSIQSRQLLEGLTDTFLILGDACNEAERKILEPFAASLKTFSNDEAYKQTEMKDHIEVLSNDFNSISEKLNNDPASETYRWKQIVSEQLIQIRDHVEIFEPWRLVKNAPPRFTALASFKPGSTLNELLRTAAQLQTEAAGRLNKESNTEDENSWLATLQTALTKSVTSVSKLIFTSEVLAQQCEDFADMEWDFLYDGTRHLFTIGYNVQEHQADGSYYDLLASEVRLCVFVCIAQGKLPEESWFALGRLLTNVDGKAVLLSWSGSMFEYLMPLLVMPTYENTLLDQTYKVVVDWQIQYGKKTNKPWGISESGYNRVNANSNYQYRAFGAPRLGLKRGLEEDTVIAPYASMLALMVSPEKACENLELLHKKGLEGRYGFYEAIDYTPSRLQRGQTNAIVYSFMSHHHGMSLLALAYLLQDKPMQRLFEAEPQFKASLLLLQEKIPKATIFFAHSTDVAEIDYVTGGQETRIVNTPDTSMPRIQLLSNGRYHVMITNAGGGYSRWKDLAVTRWHEDVTCDNWGTFCYVRDLDTGEYWSNTHQPTLKKADRYEAAYSQGRADFNAVHHGIETHTEMVVSPEDDIEMRRLRLTNRSGTRKTIEITSYAEVVMASPASDIAAPAFSNLFVQTKILSHQYAIMCTRRPRSAKEQPPWMFHLMTLEGKSAEEISYETDRMAFVGRSNSRVNPQAMRNAGMLTGSEGSVLDPIVAIRYKIILNADETATLNMVIGITESKELCQGLINKYQDQSNKDRVFEMAWTHSQVVLRQINASETDAQLYGRLASSIIYSNALFRADPVILINNRRQQSGLWGYSISGDLPIVLLKIESQDNLHMVKQLIQAHAYWHLKGLLVDLVIWNEEPSGYRQVFQNEIEALVPVEFKDRPGGIFVRASDQISNDDRILFQTVARINIADSVGTLADHVNRKSPVKASVPYISPTQLHAPDLTPIPLPKDLVFFNGHGGFSPDGKEYVIIADNKNTTPAPWVNVIANPTFGTVVSDNGSAYSWTENAHELRLSHWSNDPVTDKTGEAFYLRDEESGHFWSTSCLPARGRLPYVIRHGFGYSVFEHIEDGIYSEMTVYVDMESTVKFIALKIRNQSGRPRKMSATGYIELVLGDSRVKTAMHIHTEIDLESGALFAKNQYSTEFNDRVAFFDVDYLKKSYTGDRTEFIGRNGTLQNPDAMRRVKLSGKTGLALDPCAAIRVPFFMADNEEQEIIFRLGSGRDANEASAIAKQFRGAVIAAEALSKVKNYWDHTIGALRVETPDTAIDLITNGWLTYQTLSSRLWGRSGFYQSGGAFGFRDQLQDVMSLIHTRPELARQQILLCASRQFKEGDVQHWWHPPSGRGVRTRISDDYLWLPFVTAFYVEHSGDKAVLDVLINYLDGRQLNYGEESYYDLPMDSHTPATVYEHCVVAIKYGLNFGVHGLPLIGTGDWNDGLDKVGQHGKGESVWLAFFLYKILTVFAGIARLHNDEPFAKECSDQALQLKKNIDEHAWDGEWYKRAWFDDGTPLGSKTDEECKIDSISQSWSVLSGGGNDDLLHTAMESAYKNLVKKEVGIIQLLEPPFDKSDLNPGYIKGYVPGVRENGGQYTHAAIWLIMAFAKLKDNQRVWELLNMINPVNHGKTAQNIATYKVEPYVVAADVYSNISHVGRGGWTWYTGSAGWLYRLITESFLGLHKRDNKLEIAPCIPKEWESFTIHYRYKSSMYHIHVAQISEREETMIKVDGVRQEGSTITLADDEREHQVQVTITSFVES